MRCRWFAFSLGRARRAGGRTRLIHPGCAQPFSFWDRLLCSGIPTPGLFCFPLSTLNYSPLLFFPSEHRKKSLGASTGAADIEGLLDCYGFPNPFSFPPKRVTLSEMHQYKLLKVQSRVVTSETGGGSRDAPPPSSRRCWCVFHQVVCVCVRRKKEGELSFSGVKMGFKVTQLSGVYHVFLRTRLFLSTHFRAHVSLGRSRCKREVSGLEAPRQVSQQ